MLEHAKKAAKIAGTILVRDYNKKITIHNKGKHDIGTSVDITAEKAVLAHLKKKFPKHAFDAEESGRQGSSSFVWAVDALDGTINYVSKFPYFCVSLALVKDGQPWIAVVYDPFRKEMFHAQQGKGAYLNNTRLRIKKVPFNKAVIATDLTTHVEYHAAFFKMAKRVSSTILGLRVTNCTSLNMAYVASSRFNGYIKNKIGFMDAVAGQLLVQEAGGKVTTFAKKPLRSEGSIVAAPPTIHSSLCQLCYRG